MKRLVAFLFVIAILVSCTNKTPKVLLFIRDGSADLEYMLKNEALVMKKTLEQSGFKVNIATITGEPISSGSIKLVPDLKLSEVSVDAYAGFILPCMAAGDSVDEKIPEEMVSMVMKAILADKPIAAQLGAVWAFAKAGLLKGKKYASLEEQKIPIFEGSIYSGRGL